MDEYANLVAVSFAEESKGYQAFGELKEAMAQARVEVLSAALVKREQSGAVVMLDGADLDTGNRTVGGGLVGMLVGVLGGPLGMLLGWGTGAVVGGAYDVRRSDRGDALLAQLSSSIPVGTTALLAEVDEVAPEVVDGIMTALGGIVVRRPGLEVLAELEAAEDAAEAADIEARKTVHEQKKAQRHGRYEERKAALHAQFSRHGDSTSGDTE